MEQKYLCIQQQLICKSFRIVGLREYSGGQYYLRPYKDLS